MSTLFFFVTLLMLLGSILFVLYALLRRRASLARKVALIASLWIAGYMIILVGVSLLTPQTVLGPHQEHCFDDMCFSVVSTSTLKTVGKSPSQLTAQGIYYLVTVQLRNAGKGRAQKPDSPSFVLVDQQGNTYDVLSDAEKVIGQDPLWDQRVSAGATEAKVYLFDVPQVAKVRGLIISEGSAPPFIIGDDSSLFHQKTLLQLPS